MNQVNELEAGPCFEATGIKFIPKIYADRTTFPIEVAGGAGPDIMDLDGPTDVVEFIKALSCLRRTDRGQCTTTIDGTGNATTHNIN